MLWWWFLSIQRNSKITSFIAKAQLSYVLKSFFSHVLWGELCCSLGIRTEQRGLAMCTIICLLAKMGLEICQQPAKKSVRYKMQWWDVKCHTLDLCLPLIHGTVFHFFTFSLHVCWLPFLCHPPVVSIRDHVKIFWAVDLETSCWVF